MSGNPADGRICEQCGYVFAPFETTCPRCARTPRPPTPATAATGRPESIPHAPPVIITSGQLPQDRLSLLKHIFQADSAFAAVIVLLAIEFLMETVSNNYRSRILSVNLMSFIFRIPGMGSVLPHLAWVLFGAMLGGVLSFRRWGWRTALILTGLALLFDARAWLWYFSMFLQSPIAALMWIRGAFFGSFLLYLFHTGVHYYVFRTLLDRKHYFEPVQTVR